MITQLPITLIKLTIGRLLYKIIHLFFRKRNYIIKRNGIFYEVDLTEGIDFSLFLFGNFQKHIVKNNVFPIPLDGVIFDIGANFGVMTLQFAKTVPNGSVYAFEPTNYAWEKLKKNISLNPEINERIIPINLYMSHPQANRSKEKAYSSWKLDKKKKNVHPIHGGSLQKSENAKIDTVDNFCERLKINKLNLIKIDTDGSEYDILLGAFKTVTKMRPFIIFEIGLYLLEENKLTFDEYLDFFSNVNYSLVEVASKKAVNKKNYTKIIPLKATTDLCAIPK